MRFLIFLLLSFGMATEWGTSFSVRTPNDDTKELDYEFSIKLEDTNDKIRYLLKRDWERELGEKYIDDVVKFSHKVHDGFYYGVDYVNKESKDIFYTTYNIGVTSNGFKIGVSLKDKTKLESFGYNVSEVNGHNVDQLKKYFKKIKINKAKPTALICHTIKGKGFPFAENNP